MTKCQPSTERFRGPRDVAKIKPWIGHPFTHRWGRGESRLQALRQDGPSMAHFLLTNLLTSSGAPQARTLRRHKNNEISGRLGASVKATPNMSSRPAHDLRHWVRSRQLWPGAGQIQPNFVQCGRAVPMWPNSQIWSRSRPVVPLSVLIGPNLAPTNRFRSSVAGRRMKFASKMPSLCGRAKPKLPDHLRNMFLFRENLSASLGRLSRLSVCCHGLACFPVPSKGCVCSIGVCVLDPSSGPPGSLPCSCRVHLRRIHDLTPVPA